MLSRLFILFTLISASLCAQNSSTKEDRVLEGEGVFLSGMKEFIAENYAQAAVYFEKVTQGYEPTAGVYHMLAKAKLGQKDLNAASLAARKSMELEKDNSFYQTFYAEILTAQQDYDAAIDLYKKIIKASPMAINNYLLLADIYVSLEDYKQAIKLYDQVEKNIGNDEEISRRKQMLYLRQDNVEDAIKEGNKLMESQPLELEYVLKQAQIMMSNQKHDKAELLLKSFLKQDGDIGEAHVMLAEIYRVKGDLAASTRELMLAFENDNLDSNIKLQVLGSYIKLVEEKPLTEQVDKAIDLTRAMIKSQPEQAASYVYLADLLMKKGDLEGARDNYLKSTDYDKSVFEVWLALVELDTKLGEVEALVKHAGSAAEYFPNQAFFWYHLGYGNVLKGDHQEAVYALEEARFLAFENRVLLKHILSLLGDSYMHTNQFVEAEKAYDEVLKIDPDYEAVLNNASYFLAARKRNLDKALSMVQHLTTLNNRNLEYADTHAWVLFQRGEFTQARAVIEAALKNGEEPNGTFLEHYGDILFKLGDKELALKQWQKAKLLGENSKLIDRKIEEQQFIEYTP
ncbi:MAG: tetratricopeptide repeat protein [Cytophagales bacterium]|nr:tetratricopeptide repeat protein [Cytophagales bacterium]